MHTSAIRQSTLSTALVVAAYVATISELAIAAEATKYPTFGTIERADPRFDKLVPKDSKIEKLAEGFDWSEGPAWNREGGFLVFSNIPPNKVMRWSPESGLTLYLMPGGYTGTSPRGGEQGSNGLLFDKEGKLVLCQHGDRRVARLEPNGKFATVADRFDGKRFNSPNDATLMSNGDIYFTDPPYGLEGQLKDPAREMNYCGVYRVTPEAVVTLLTKEMTFPNGIALSPDEKTLYVAQSDPKAPIWKAFEVKADGTLGASRVFADSASWLAAGKKGLPDGMKVDQHGNLFATGPGGVHVFAPDGTHLGSIDPGEATANCGFGDDGSTLYMTSDMYLCRIRLSTKGLGF